MANGEATQSDALEGSDGDEQGDATWANAGVDRSPVRVGAMLYTLVDPHPGFEAAYNRWYERDHQFGGCTVGAGWFSNRRFVAPRDLKSARFPRENTTVADPSTAGSYVAIYWVEASQLAEALAWSSEQVHRLYAAGRGFEERTHAHTAIYTHQADFYRDDDPTPMELALLHPYRGLISIHLDRAEGVKQGAFDAWCSANIADSLLAGDSPVASVSSWRPVVPRGSDAVESPMKLGTGPGTIQRTCQLLFVDTEPTAAIEIVRAWADMINDSGLGTVQLVAPFVPTIPGTDVYADELFPVDG